jgi:presenilin-like A22 family membrane protease
MIQAFILISVGWTLLYVFYALFSVFLPQNINLNLTLTIILSVGLTVLLYKFPEWYVIDITGVILGAGSASIFGISLDIIPTLLLLVVLLIYDYIAVYQTKHMVALAEGVMDLRLPILLVIPKHWKYSFLSEKFDKEDREAFFMGLGDAVMPTLLVVSANFFVTNTAFYSFPLIGKMNLPAIGGILGTFLGFAVLMTFVMKGKPQAGLPFLNGGVILGYVVGSLIAGSSILGGVL